MVLESSVVAAGALWETYFEGDRAMELCLWAFRGPPMVFPRPLESRVLYKRSFEECGVEY